MRKIWIALVLTIPFTVAADDSFSYLTLDGDTLTSTHGIRLSLSAPDGFFPVDPVNVQVGFVGDQINMSAGAFTSVKAAMLIVAEKTIDPASPLDYSRLAEITVSGIDFRMRERCIEIDPDLIVDVDELSYLASGGFWATPAVYGRQLFMVSESGDDEYALTYVKRVDNCSAELITDEYKADFAAEFEKNVQLTQPVK